MCVCRMIFADSYFVFASLSECFPCLSSFLLGVDVVTRVVGDGRRGRGGKEERRGLGGGRRGVNNQA